MYLTDGTIKNRQKILIRRNYVLAGLGYSIDTVIQADTPIKQCCNFSRDSLAFETTETCTFEYHRHKDGGLFQN